MSKFLSINFFSESELKVYLNTFIGKQIEWKNCSYFCKAGKYFENTDSYFLQVKAYIQLYKVYSEITEQYKINFKLPVNSLFRPAFSVLTDNGKKYTDLLDLTTLYSHFLGISIDFDFSMFERDTGLSRNILIEKLTKHGFFAPFSAPENGGEYWHYSLKHDFL